MTRSTLRGVALAGMLGLLAAASAAVAQVPAAHDLSRIMPKDSLLYFSWVGSEATVGTEQTAWHKLMAEPEMAAAMDTFWPRLEQSLQKLAAKEGGQEGAAAFEHGYGIFKLLWKYPFALSIGKVGMSEDVPGVSAYLVVRAGDQAKQIQEHIVAILEMIGKDEGRTEAVTVAGVELRQLAGIPIPLPVRFGVVKDCFIVTVGQTATEELIASISGTAPSLAGNPRFAATMKNAGGTDGSFSVYLDVRGVIDTLRGFSPLFMAMRVPVLGDAPTFRKLLQETGLDDVEAVAYTVRPEAGGYMGRTFAYMPAAATQPDRSPPAPPVSDANLALIPADTNWGWAGTFDLACLYDTVLRVVHEVSPKTGQEMDREIAKAETKLGVKLRDDVLAALGSDWVLYDAPGNGGILVTGITLSCGLRDADRFRQSVEKLVGFMEDESRGEVKAEIETYRGQTIVFVNVKGLPMPVAPAWTIQGNRITLALYPQMVRTAIDRQKDNLPNLLSNPDFQRGRKLLPPNADSVSYQNTAKGMSDIYSILLPLAQMGMAMAQKEGVDMNVSMLPSSHTLCKHLFGAVSGSARTTDGYLAVSHGPWPINAPAFVGGGSVPIIAGMTSILLPSLARARELAKRTVSTANLAGIGQAMMIYSRDHNDAFPPTLETLVAKEMIGPKVLISPRDPECGPCSYEYIAGQKNTGDPRNIVAYEKLYDWCTEGTNVLFLDSHVEWMPQARFEKALAETRERLGAAAEKGEKGDSPAPTPREGRKPRAKRTDRPTSRPAVERQE